MKKKPENLLPLTDCEVTRACVYTNYMYTKQKTRLWPMKYSYMGLFIKYS